MDGTAKLPYFAVSKHPPKISTPGPHYEGFGQNYEHLGRHYVQKGVLTYRKIRYKVRGPAETHLVGNMDLKLDISESVTYLTEQEYLVENFCVFQRSTKGIV